MAAGEEESKTTSPPSSVKKDEEVPFVSGSTKCYMISFDEGKEGGGETAAKAVKAPPTSLQERFAKYREEKVKALELQRKERAGLRARPRTEEEKNALREKFIAKAKEYIGVPYAKRYCDPGTEEYESELFLDCCGLVRRAMRDLQDDFGFRIGGWNQAYQYDTLSENEVTEEEAKPGDLIFWAAEYVNPKQRVFKFNMVHVEIYLGEGRTLGSRWRKGKVSEFESYKFESKNWKDPVIRFCSIDPWLEGECRPRVHEWTSRSLEWCADKRSIFRSADGGGDGSDDADEPAEDDEC